MGDQNQLLEAKHELEFWEKEHMKRTEEFFEEKQKSHGKGSSRSWKYYKEAKCACDHALEQINYYQDQISKIEAGDSHN